MPSLPIDKILPELRHSCSAHNRIILSADPGAGKTTKVPIALLDEVWLTGKKIVMLEPRRLAARRAATYISQQMNEKLGKTVGYTIRGERVASKETRLEIVTEGILTRIIQDDPALPEIGLIIFDEFHERSIHADLGLALALDIQENLRSDLKILIMSATLDEHALSTMLGDAPVIRSEGKQYPVTTHYAARKHEDKIEPVVVAAILRALRDEEGDALVFLPGQREIRRVESLLENEELPDGVIVHTLYGEASSEHQQAALDHAPRGKRKVILSTSIAETSLTIDGVRIVIDSGLSRMPKFDPRRGMSGLITTSVSKANADQRRGRAARQNSGVCYRLWTEQDQNELPAFLPPEILTSDLAPLTLELARWGTADGKNLHFLDPPPPLHSSQARTLLTQLGALTLNGEITPHGKVMAELPIHPRLAHMLIRGKELHFGALACDVAALLEERDLLRSDSDSDIDLFSRWYVLRKGGQCDRYARDRAITQATRLRRMLGVDDKKLPEEKLGVLLALAYPERVAKQREVEGGRYQLSGGSGAIVPKTSRLLREQYLAIGDVDGIGTEVKVFLAAPITEEEIRMAFACHLVEEEEVHWDERLEGIVARKVTRLGSIELSETTVSPSVETLREVMIEGIRLMGLDALPWSKEAQSIKVRSEWLRKNELVRGDWVNLSEESLLESLPEWLGHYLTGFTKKAHLERLNVTQILHRMFSFHQLRELEELAPTHLSVPTGSRIPIDYSAGEIPVLAVRLQEMFGEVDTPTVAGGRVKVLLHLLSPAYRPLAVTQDLPSFWKNAYPDVRKEMRGRYPKHHWPDNPLEAEPTKRAKRRN